MLAHGKCQVPRKVSEAQVALIKITHEYNCIPTAGGLLPETINGKYIIQTQGWKACRSTYIPAAIKELPPTL